MWFLAGVLLVEQEWYLKNTSDIGSIFKEAAGKQEIDKISSEENLDGLSECL